MHVLIAEDERITRRFLQKCLEEQGHDVVVAENGLAAWNAWQTGEFPMVVSDWHMPEMDGPDLVRRIRAADHSGYCYLIMLTARSEKKDIVTGMEAGADDFLSKPFDRSELRVRIRAGERIIDLERTLAERNELLEQNNQRMSHDLAAAAQVQQALLPTTMPQSHVASFAWGFRPCDELAGDILNVFQLDEQHIGLYLADVSGHGVAASLLSVTISRVMTPEPWQSSLLSRQVEDNGTTRYEVASPADVAAELNKRFPMDEHYFTIVYAVLNTETRELSFVSAGHPSILRMTDTGESSFLECPNMAIGWVPNQRFSQQTVQLESGDRLCLYSDGITEACGSSSTLFGGDRLADRMRSLQSRSLEHAIEEVITDVLRWCGPQGPGDDLSVLGVEIA